MISEKHHFVKDGEGVFLNVEGKKLFVSEFEEKMHKIISVKEQEYTYERLIQQEIKNLGNSILHGEPYKAYKHQN